MPAAIPTALAGAVLTKCYDVLQDAFSLGFGMGVNRQKLNLN
jgi:hypothetical protein